MHKKIKMGIVVLVFLWLSGCGTIEEEYITEAEESSVVNEMNVNDERELSGQQTVEDNFEERYKYPELFDNTLVNMEGDFYKKIDSNPIDADFTWEDTGTLDRIGRARAYCDAWIAEIENSLLVLEEYLTEEDYEMICSSYEGWKQYLENSFSVEQSIFYTFSKYDGYPLAGGSLTYPRVMEITSMRARNYAIEIKSLEYIFTEEVEFVYCKQE